MQQNVIQNIKKGKQILSYATTDKSQGHYSNELCQAQNTRHTVYDFIHPKNLQSETMRPVLRPKVYIPECLLLEKQSNPINNLRLILRSWEKPEKSKSKGDRRKKYKKSEHIF